MRSHFALPRAALAGVVSTGIAALAGVSAGATIAADTPSDPAYADGLQPGDNGGFGFSPWNMDGTYNSSVQHAMNSSSPYNQLGLAWTLYNPDGRPVIPANAPEGGLDVSQAGRGFSPLQVGDTISIVVDNPTQRAFFRGYTVRLNSGGGNTTYGGTIVSRLAIGTFEYFANGAWYLSPTANEIPTLTDLDTDEGVRIEVTLTEPDVYFLTMTPLDEPQFAFTTFGSLGPGGPIDWIEVEMYNTDSDFHPTPVVGAQATDFYVSSISIDFADADQDGVTDAADNCPYAPNVGQQDAGGIGAGSLADGIGDACQCGNVFGSGRVLADDVTVYRQSLANPTGAPLPAGAQGRCAVIGASPPNPTTCGVHQVSAIRRALNAPPLPPITHSAVAQVCEDALP